MPENLWALREQKKISVAMLANRAGLPIGLIMEYESGLRSIDPRHLSRIARALYLEETDIKLRSDPRPGSGPLERQPSRETGYGPEGHPPVPQGASGSKVEGSRLRGEGSGRPPRPRPEPRPPAPARPSQIAHLENLLKHLNLTVADLEAEIGKRLSTLDRAALSTLLKDLQVKVKEAPVPVRHRAYLPESVDEFEARYLTEAQEAGAQLHFTLFDGSTVDGQIIGYGPYSITARMADGAEVTLNKLALVSYVKVAGDEERGKPIRRGTEEQRSGRVGERESRLAGVEAKK